MSTTTVTPDASLSQVPLVDYLELGDPPHLVVNECTHCAARYVDRRNACASCGRTEFAKAYLSDDGIVVAFTIVHFAGPGVVVPFVAAVVDCAGTRVRANLVGVAPDPASVATGMKVRLRTYSLGHDNQGVEAVGFGYAPIS